MRIVDRDHLEDDGHLAFAGYRGKQYDPLQAEGAPLEFRNLRLREIKK